MKWFVNVSQFQAIKLKLLSWEQGCVRKEETGLGKKESVFQFRLKNLLKIASLNEANFQWFVWYYTVTIKNKFCLACRSSFQIVESNLFSNYQKKTLKCRRPSKNINQWRRQKLIKNGKLLVNCWQKKIPLVFP